MSGRFFSRILLCTLIILLLAGCAKYPDTAAPVPAGADKLLVVTFRMRGVVEPTDPADPAVARYYFVAIDNDGDDQTGPIAVYGPPYGGNGWVTSDRANESLGMTSFIRYDAANPQGNVYEVLPGTQLTGFSAPSPVLRYEILEGGRTLRFTIDFSQIATTAIPAANIDELDINIITTNELPTGGAISLSRETDGIGPTGSDFVTVNTELTNQLYYDNDTDAIAVTDENLDIEYWSIEVVEAN